MGQQPVVTHGDPQPGDHIEDGEHGPIQPGISIDQPVARDSDHGAGHDRPEEEVGPELMVNPMNNVGWNWTRDGVLHVDTIVKRAAFRKCLPVRQGY